MRFSFLSPIFLLGGFPLYGATAHGSKLKRVSSFLLSLLLRFRLLNPIWGLSLYRLSASGTVVSVFDVFLFFLFLVRFVSLFFVCLFDFDVSSVVASCSSWVECLRKSLVWR